MVKILFESFLLNHTKHIWIDLFKHTELNLSLLRYKKQSHWLALLIEQQFATFDKGMVFLCWQIFDF